MLSVFTFISCKFFADGEKDSGDEASVVSSIKLSKASLELKVGAVDYISFSYTPENALFMPEVDYDETKLNISVKNNGLVITGLAEAKTSITVSSGNASATCLVNVTGYEVGYEKIIEPYIYSTTNILQLTPGNSEKVFVSLYGGSAADINDYTWSVDDSSVCKAEPTGQYCLLKAISPGYTRIKITHTKSTYPYYMGVYVFEDPSKSSYITTTDNVITMNLNEPDQTITVSLINGLETSKDIDFNWEIVDKKDNCPIELTYNATKGVVTPKQSGNCTIRITHPDAVYPLDILCRVITIVKNVYIEPDSTIVTLEGDKEEKVTSTLVNLDLSEYSLNDFQYEILNPEIATIKANIGNEIYLQGLKNGSTKLIISHLKSAYKREVLLISTNQKADAVDVSCYITTADNYIRTKVGGEQIPVNISLKGGDAGDEKDFCWSITSTAADGSKNPVISLDTPTGSVFNRMAQSTYSYGAGYISPLREGTAVISVTHPKVLYPTEILVKVLGKDAILEAPLYFSGDGIVKLLNGDSYTYNVSLNGENKVYTDNQNIEYSIDDNRISISGNEDKVIINAPSKGTGNTVSHLSISHKKVDYPKSVLVLTADTEEELKNIKALYADKNYYNFEVGKTVSFVVNAIGFEEDFDFSSMNWNIENPNIITIETNPNEKRNITITGINSGTTKLTASIGNTSCVYTITVYPVGAVKTDPEIYFTTTENVVVFNEENTSKSLNITAVNMKPNLYSEISWKVENEEVCKIVPNGTSASITAVKEGETIINISHPLSQNQLKVYVKVGSEYILQSNKSIYISSTDVITMLRDDQPQKIQAILVNYDGDDKEHFTFSIDNTNVAKISAQSPNGIAYISPVGSGQAEVTISNTLSDITKKVLIVVGNSAEELAGITYLTTTNNVVSIGEGKYKNVSVSVENAEEIVLDGYTWTSSDRNIADVTSNGATASIKANKEGTALITVTNKVCKYSLQIIVHVVDPIAAAEHPYIQLSSSVLVANIDNSYTSLTADLIGGSEDDFANFVWSSNDNSICSVYGQNEVGKFKAISEGTTYITVSHPKADYSAQVLVICEAVKESECYISVPSSIINMKPTDDSTSITATLINGGNNDKYNFTWSLDVYDVIDFQYSANVCTIKPKQTGSATITISHPKAEYDQQIIVNVQEYSEFNFPDTNITLTQGDVKFLNMEIPNTSVKTHVEYIVKNPTICSVAGTKEVAQITGIGKGSTTVTAKLVASNTGVEQASADLLVYVKEKVVTDAYITAGSTIYTLVKGKSQTLKASLSGSNIVASDNSNLQWTTSDSDIISVTGIGANGYVKGASIYITAKKAGEAIITCSHEKAGSDLQFYVVVPGSEKKIITLNKSYATIVKGSSGTTLTANIENAESNSDYENLEWSSVAANGKDGNAIARVMGTGKNVQIYPVSPGEVTIMCQSKDTDSVGKCTVVVEAGKSFVFENTNVKVAPMEKKIVKYKVSPANALISWTRTSMDDYFTYNDLGADADGNGKLEVTGVTEGSGTLIASTDGGATNRITIQCGWTYTFVIKGNTSFNINPTQSITYDYSVIPSDANIDVQSPDKNVTFKATVNKGAVTYDDKLNEVGNGKITITPLKETSSTVNINIVATNTTNGNTVGSQKLTGYIKYSELHPLYKSFTRDIGKWSYFNLSTDKYSGSLVIGDGETITLKYGISESNFDGSISKINFSKASTAGTAANDLEFIPHQDGSDMSITVKHKNDIVDQKKMYHVKNVWVDPRYPNMKDFCWEVHWKTGGTFGKDHDDYFRLLLPGDNSSNTNSNIYQCYLLWSDEGSNDINGFTVCDSITAYDPNGNRYNTYGTVAHESLTELQNYRDIYITEEELKNNPWFYCPGTIQSESMDSMYTYADILKGTYKVGSFGTGSKVTVEPHIMTSHIDCVETNVVSTDDESKSYVFVGDLQVYVKHFSSEKNVASIPVYVETRNSKCN